MLIDPEMSGKMIYTYVTGMPTFLLQKDRYLFFKKS